MLKIVNLNAYYDKLKILNNINLQVKKGESVAILGPNGAGKTTLLKSICGLVRTEGKIVFDGVDITNMKTHERIRMGISICPEGRRLFPNLTVEDNLMLANPDHDLLNFVYDLFPVLKERKRQKVKTLSGGEQQMLAIARALMLNPKLMLMDEPSMGLAPIVIRRIEDAIKNINCMGVSILLVEQNVHLAFNVAERVYILVNGEIVREGDVKSIKNLEKDYFEI